MAAETATQSITIHATPAHCYAVVTDFERYPEWANDVKQATVVARDEQGRAFVLSAITGTLSVNTCTATKFFRRSVISGRLKGPFSILRQLAQFTPVKSMNTGISRRAAYMMARR